jgi:hypothetical protein
VAVPGIGLDTASRIIDSMKRPDASE